MEWKHFMEVGQFNSEDQEELLEYLYKHMYIVAYAKMRNRSDALDIVQESWVKILGKLDTLRDPEKLTQWSKVIVSNTAMNALKKKASQQVSCYEENMIVTDLDVGVYIVELIQKETINESLFILDEDTRNMIVCKFYYGWKDSQIAQIMEMPVGTVKARIHRAKLRLKRHLISQFGETYLSSDS